MPVGANKWVRRQGLSEQMNPKCPLRLEGLVPRRGQVSADDLGISSGENHKKQKEHSVYLS